MFKKNKAFFPLNEQSVAVKKPYGLSVLLKQATQIKTEMGYSAAITFLEDVDSDFCLTGKDYTRLIRRLATYYLKDKNRGRSIEDFFLRVFDRILDDPLDAAYIDIHCLYASCVEEDDAISYLQGLIDTRELTDYEHKRFISS